MSQNHHIAIIPARKNSIGYPGKNRLFFKYTRNFIKKINWFENIYLSSDDEWFKKKCKENKYHFVKRSKKLSGSKISIKKVIDDFVKKKKIKKNYIIWLIYIPLLPKSKKLYDSSKKLIEKKNIKSICGFTKVETHPYLTWYKKNNKLYKFCKNNVFRRQDLPLALSHNHIICAFRCSEIKYLDEELININTKPILIKGRIKEID
tara:strand:+ start:2136 stop:2750 length:615 start_codon:yes stop_codon:yes gene_type:complete